jgi:hypothetical protein
MNTSMPSNEVTEQVDITPPGAQLSVAEHKPAVKEGRKGYVALLDVLGFRSLITGTAGAEWVAEYLSIVNFVTGLWDLESIVFSDSIVITKEGGGAESLHQVCEACSMLMYELILKDIPVRGAIAYGLYYRSPFDKSVFVAGRPIVDAYDTEKKQDWVGVILDTSAINAPHGVNFGSETIESFSNVPARADIKEHMKWRALVRRYSDIPVKSGE